MNDLVYRLRLILGGVLAGDGVTDDTAAIQLAISDGGRCGANCGGSTVYPATVYFPSGTYIISSSIIMYYNTEMLGNVRPLYRPEILRCSLTRFSLQSP